MPGGKGVRLRTRATWTRARRVSERERVSQSKPSFGLLPTESNAQPLTQNRSRRESNPHLRFRKPPFYPLNYGNNDISILDFRFPIANCRVLQRISAMRRLRLVTSSLRKTAWRCFFTIGKL